MNRLCLTTVFIFLLVGCTKKPTWNGFVLNFEKQQTYDSIKEIPNVTAVSKGDFSNDIRVNFNNLNFKNQFPVVEYSSESKSLTIKFIPNCTSLGHMTLQNCEEKYSEFESYVVSKFDSPVTLTELRKLSNESMEIHEYCIRKGLKFWGGINLYSNYLNFWFAKSDDCK